MTTETTVTEPTSVNTGSLINTDIEVSTNEEVKLEENTEEVSDQVTTEEEANPLQLELDELRAKHTAPETYELPEGVEVNESFTAFAKELNLSQDNFNKAMEFLNQDKANSIQAHNDASISLLGSNANDRLNTFSAKAKAMLSEDDFQLLQHATSPTAGSAGAAIILLEKFMLKQEHNPVSQPTSVPTITESDLTEMMANPRYKTDPDYRKKVTEGFTKLYG